MSAILNYKYTSVSDLTSDSIGSFDASLNNGTAQVTNVNSVNQYGNTAHFDGSTDYIMSTTPTTLTNNSARSFSIWIYPTVDDTNQRILSTLGGSGVHIIQKRSDNNKISLQNASFEVTSSSVIPLNTWTHVTFTYNGTNTNKVYVNGVLENTSTFAWTLLDSNPMNYIGGTNGALLFSGNMLDFRLYDSLLTDVQVSDIFTSGPQITTESENNTIPGYQSDPPVNDAVVSLRIKDLDTLSDGDNVTSWGSATATSTPIYNNPSDNFPYVDLDNGYFTLGQYNIAPSLGFTYIGLVYTTEVGPQYPLVWSYAEGANDGIRIYRTGGSGQDLVFRSQKVGNITATAEDETTINTWQVFTARATDNGDSTVTMEIFVDNILKASTNAPSSDMSGIVSGLLEVGQSTAWGGNPVSPIYISDCFFYDRSLSDVELLDMYNYLLDMNNQVSDNSSVISNDMSGVPGVFFMNLTWTSLVGALKYKIEYSGTDGSNGTSITSENSVNIGSLNPNIEYVFTLYSTDGAVFMEYGTALTISTLDNVEANYDITYFENSDNVTDLSSLETTELGFIDENLNNLLNTGDIVVRDVLSSSKNTTFINIGDTIDSTSSGGAGEFLIPFTQSSGAGQEVIISSGTENISISYDESNDQVIIGGVSYSDGESVIVDGKRLVFHNV